MSVGIAATVIGAGVSLFSASKSASAQEDASKRSAQVQREISDENVRMQTDLAAERREDFQPWKEAGEEALSQLQAGIDSGEFLPSAPDVRKDTGYGFRIHEGLQALDRSAASRGRLQSGAHMKAVTRFGQDLASQEYENAYSREANKKARQYNILAGLSTGGQSSAAGQAQATGQLAQTSGNILQNLGAGQSQAYLQQGQAQAQGYQDTARTVNQAAQNWLMYKNLGK